MQATSDLYKELLRTPGCRKETVVEIAGENYGEDRIILLNPTPRLFRNNQMEVGSAVAADLRFSLLHPGDIPVAAEIIPKYRLRVGDRVSEWVQKGVYYIYTREPAEETDTLFITAFDAMVRGDKVWEPDQSLTFPMTMRRAVEVIAALMGVEVDNLDAISTEYTIDYPANDWTQRNILQFIAAAHGGNFCMTDLGRLRLVFLNDLPEETSYLVDGYGSAITFGGVRILV